MKPIFTGRKCLAGLPVAAMFLFSIPAHAALTGNLAVDSCAGQATVTSTSINFTAGPGFDPQCVQTGLSSNLTSSYGNIVGSLIGTISDLTGPPVGQAFLTFDPPPAGGSSLVFNLTSVGPGSPNTNCADTGFVVSCSINLGGALGVSPFVLTGLTNTSISLAVAGTVSDANGTSNWSGTFSSDYDGSPQAVANLFNTQGSLTSTFSGRITVREVNVVPEPGSMALLGAGLLGLGLVARRRTSARRS